MVLNSNRTSEVET